LARVARTTGGLVVKAEAEVEAIAGLILDFLKR